ncbi:phage integrase family protein [Burkholderia territorii]|uniref:phage integrase family protein n=1 Tax=Burkholderia territorii TaxID=1503055 RepID=UPI001E4898C7|nr:phage integrase family protein [Burkholderia territorii]
MWGPTISRRPTGQGVATAGELVSLCNRRGCWWCSAQHIRHLPARIVVAWLRQYAQTPGVTVDYSEPPHTGVTQSVLVFLCLI